MAIPRIRLLEVDSTNVYAKKLLKEGREPSFLVMAESQTMGRGRLGKHFFSPKGGLYMSLALKYGGSEEQITLAAAVAVCRILERYCGVRPHVKWVNDLLVDGKKVCGILCEAVCGQDGSIGAVIVGVGVNTQGEGYVFPNELKDTAGTVQSTLSNQALAHEIAREIVRTVTRGAKFFLPAYEARLLTPS